MHTHTHTHTHTQTHTGNRFEGDVYFYRCINKGAWASAVKDTFVRTGLLDSFQNNSNVNIYMVKETLSSVYQNKWTQDILHKPKLRTFVICYTYCMHLETGRYRGI